MEKEERYKELIQQAAALFSEEDDLIARMANLSALLYMHLPHVNWAGFYRNIHDKLILGPFQGKPACNPILFGKGVCGTCAITKRFNVYKMFMNFLVISLVMQIVNLKLFYLS